MPGGSENPAYRRISVSGRIHFLAGEDIGVFEQKNPACLYWETALQLVGNINRSGPEKRHWEQKGFRLPCGQTIEKGWWITDRISKQKAAIMILSSLFQERKIEVTALDPPDFD